MEQECMSCAFQRTDNSGVEKLQDGCRRCSTDRFFGGSLEGPRAPRGEGLLELRPPNGAVTLHGTSSMGHPGPLWGSCHLHRPPTSPSRDGMLRNDSKAIASIGAPAVGRSHGPVKFG